jgi:hypothetical protein
MANGDNNNPGTNGGEANIEQVAGEDILERYGVSGPVTQAGAQELGPLQKVGYKLALWVMVYIAAVTLIIFISSFYPIIHFPSAPAAPSQMTPENVAQYKAEIEVYRTAVDVANNLIKMQLERALQLFQLVIASTALPALTAILGYIFGSRKGGE